MWKNRRNWYTGYFSRFSISISISESIMECPQNCHGNGDCLSGTCHCFPGFLGPDCSRGKMNTPPHTMCIWAHTPIESNASKNWCKCMHAMHNVCTPTHARHMEVQQYAVCVSRDSRLLPGKGLLWYAAHKKKHCQCFPLCYPWRYSTITDYVWNS